MRTCLAVWRCHAASTAHCRAWASGCSANTTHKSCCTTVAPEQNYPTSKHQSMQLSLPTSSCSPKPTHQSGPSNCKQQFQCPMRTCLAVCRCHAASTAHCRAWASGCSTNTTHKSCCTTVARKQNYPTSKHQSMSLPTSSCYHNKSTQQSGPNNCSSFSASRAPVEQFGTAMLPPQPTAAPGPLAAAPTPLIQAMLHNSCSCTGRTNQSITPRTFLFRDRVDSYPLAAAIITSQPDNPSETTPGLISRMPTCLAVWRCPWQRLGLWLHCHLRKSCIMFPLLRTSQPPSICLCVRHYILAAAMIAMQQCVPGNCKQQASCLTRTCRAVWRCHAASTAHCSACASGCSANTSHTGHATQQWLVNTTT
jgi:hypothetical protein